MYIIICFLRMSIMLWVSEIEKRQPRRRRAAGGWRMISPGPVRPRAIGNRVRVLNYLIERDCRRRRSPPLPCSYYFLLLRNYYWSASRSEFGWNDGCRNRDAAHAAAVLADHYDFVWDRWSPTSYWSAKRWARDRSDPTSWLTCCSRDSRLRRPRRDGPRSWVRRRSSSSTKRKVGSEQ